ncbi:hypothetical protein MHYP_G00201590 [Metynnis hypsauchen]
MENYKMTAVDIETGMGDVYRATVESGKPSRNWIWNVVGVVFLIGLCSAASFLFAWHFTRHSQRDPTTTHQSTPTTEHHRQILTKIGNNTKAAIHLREKQREKGIAYSYSLLKTPLPLVSGLDDKNQRMKWVNGVDQSFSAGGLKLENNEIVIPSDGLYFVYSQASFEVPCKETESNTALSYSVRWSSPAAPSEEYPRYLLMGVKSVCPPNTDGRKQEEDERQAYDIIYLGAVFRLYKGDRLSTEANHHAHIETQSSKTFFGVFEL